MTDVRRPFATGTSSGTESPSILILSILWLKALAGTGLAAGLFMTHQVLQRERILHPDVQSLVILLTDGAGNVAISPLPPQDEAHMLCDQIAIDKFRCVVINMEHAAFDQGLAQALAEHLKAPCYTLSELKAETLYQTVRDEMLTGSR